LMLMQIMLAVTVYWFYISVYSILIYKSVCVCVCVCVCIYIMCVRVCVCV
jgi:hypothetical protein